ncbi:hypothetical protein B0H16DRAFT_1583841 [Mycena metata]|uniref:F-box domain-containing protein n=1 Tax=Mycena metata TaxID=1033252 RepID=A0AAD7HYQ0_9AGAR|nr:hypothetical protein B0H16DRAFT_1583841 [Mycena metata]
MAPDLPVELLRDIFAMSAPTREEAIELGRTSFLDVPWSLTLVCRQWRAIALSMPSLWSSITIVIAAWDPVGVWTKYPLGLLEAQIARSGTHALQVVLISEEDPGYTTQKIFSTIVSSCDRWETLELASASHLQHLHRMRHNIPLLRQIYLSVPNQLGRLLAFAPQLQVARIVSPGVKSRADSHQAELNTRVPYPITLPWAQLRIFESSYDDPRQIDGMLLAQDLVECQVRIALRHAPWQPPAQPVVFQHLRKLTLAARAPHLDALLLPSLEALVLTLQGEFNHAVDMLQRSACSLRKLWVNECDPSVEQLLSIFSSNPNLFEIGLLGSNNNITAVVAALTLGPGKPVYAPDLTRFHAGDTRSNDTDQALNAILDMVESRLNLFHLHGCSRLEVLSLVRLEYRVYRPDFLARIEAFQAAGLEVDFKNPEGKWSFRLGVSSGRLQRYI